MPGYPKNGRNAYYYKQHPAIPGYFGLAGYLAVTSGNTIPGYTRLRTATNGRTPGAPAPLRSRGRGGPGTTTTTREHDDVNSAEPTAAGATSRPTGVSRCCQALKAIGKGRHYRLAGSAQKWRNDPSRMIR